ncbi:DUF397 domain-containing protein [Streptomyces sp. CA-181903]|uniref:DUF397 domain-containing protein n=1 Tax=Streptomyces sp. CA-181903 TaxID=3240055 RepID=UPI003D8B7E3A
MDSTSDICAQEWRASSYSNTTGGNCVEVAAQVPNTVRVRDSKATERTSIRLTRASWESFVGAVGEGAL